LPGRSIGRSTVRNMMLADRPEGQNCPFAANDYNSECLYKGWFSWAVFIKIFRELFFQSFQCFTASLKGDFEPKNFIFYLFLKCEKNQRKESLWEISFDPSLQIYLVFFLSVFLCYFSFQTLFFLTLELSSLILSIGSCFCKKNYLWSIVITKCYF